MSEALEKLKAAKAQYDAEIQKLKDDFSANKFSSLIAEVFKNAFDALPDLQAIGWTQYTPSFNDGDPCTFSIGGPTFLFDKDLADLNEEEREDILSDPNEWNSHYQFDKKKEPEKRELLKTINADINGPLEPVFQAMFGEGQKIIIRRNGTVEIEEYDYGY